MMDFHFFRSATAKLHTAFSSGDVFSPLCRVEMAASRRCDTDIGTGEASSTFCSVVKISDAASDRATDTLSSSLSSECLFSALSSSS